MVPDESQHGVLNATRQRFSLALEIAEEHLALQAIVHWLEVELERATRGVEGAEGTGALLRALEIFGENLRTHFSFEERGGLLRAAILALPDGQALYLDWKLQHVEFLTRLDGCLEALRSKAGTSLALGACWQAFRTLGEDLRTHEAFESRLLGEKGSEEARTRPR